MPKEIIKRETRFSVHLPKNCSREDTHYIKEQITYKDNTQESRVFTVTDFERPVWVTSQSARNHKEKKEYEDLDNLITKKTTESDLNRTTANLLGQVHLSNNINALKDSPFVYGHDLSSTSFLKLASLRKNNNVQSPYSVATFDIETTTCANKDILLATLTMKNGEKTKVYTGIVKSYLRNVTDFRPKYDLAMKTYLPQYEGKLELEMEVFDTVLELLTKAFKVANDWAPDFLAIWNMNFDIPVVIDNIQRANGKLTDVICDQDLPENFRYCRYKQGVTKKVMASGKVMPVNPSLQWHSLNTTSKFYVIDAMCVYRQLRMGAEEPGGYSLDAILRKEMKTKKLTFTQADKYKGGVWHDFMVANYPIEYIVYNQYDCLSMLELDGKIKDLSLNLPSFASMTDFSRFSSQSRKLSDALFIFGAKKGRILGTAPAFKDEDEIDDSMLEQSEDDDEDGEYDPNDYDVLGLKGWIQLLPQSLLVADGLSIFEDAPWLKSNMRGLVSDVDSVSSYPSATNAANVSKETTVHELISVTDVTEEVFRQQNLGICLGNANLLEYFEVMFGGVPLEELDLILDQYT